MQNAVPAIELEGKLKGQKPGSGQQERGASQKPFIS